MDWQLAGQLGSSIAIASYSTTNNYGERVYSTSKSHSARIVGESMLVLNSQGETQTSHQQLILSSTVTVDTNARIYLPGESSSGNDGWAVLRVAVRYDETGTSDYIKVWLGDIV